MAVSIGKTDHGCCFLAALIHILMCSVTSSYYQYQGQCYKAFFFFFFKPSKAMVRTAEETRWGLCSFLLAT